MDKLWFTFSEEVIVKFQYFFFQKFKKHSTINSKDGYVLVFVKKPYYQKTSHIYTADLSQLSWKSKTGNFVISYLLWV